MWHGFAGRQKPGVRAWRVFHSLSQMARDAQREMAKAIPTPARSAGFSHEHASDAATVAQSSPVASQINHCPRNADG